LKKSNEQINKLKANPQVTEFNSESENEWMKDMNGVVNEWEMNWLGKRTGMECAERVEISSRSHRQIQHSILSSKRKNKVRYFSHSLPPSRSLSVDVDYEITNFFV
jgi:hypothetical protein